MPATLKIPAAFLLVSNLFSSCYYDIEEDLYPLMSSCDTTQVDYGGSVLPIMEANCYSCHSISANQGSIILEGYDNLKMQADNGRLEGTINHNPGFSPMPKNAGKLNPCELLIISKWISDGALNN